MEKENGRKVSKAKLILLACLTMLMCVALIVTGTFALFSDNATIKNHLQSGTLDATLTRTYLEYNKLENEVLVPYADDTYLLLNDTTTEDANVFGISDGLTYIVPGSFFEATLELKNNGNVAFNYGIEIVFTEGGDTALAKQLTVTVTDHLKNVHSTTMDDATGKIQIETGNALKSTDGAVEFTVNVTFENIIKDESNNDAMNQNVKFDLIVTATQAA